MKRLILLFYFLIFFLTPELNAQFSQHKIDSLETELSVAKTDTSKIRILEKLIYANSNLNQVDAAKRYLIQMRKLVGRTDWIMGKVLLYHQLMKRKFNYDYEWDSAIYYGKKGLYILNESPDVFHKAWPVVFSSAIGLIYKNMDEFDSAFYYYDRSIESLDVDDVFSAKSLSIAYRNIMNLNKKFGNNKAVLEYAYKIEGLAKKYNDEELLLAAYTDLTNAYYYLKLSEKAVGMADKIIAAYEKDSLQYITKMYEMYRVKGRILRSMGKYEEATKYFLMNYAFEKKSYGEKHQRMAWISIYLGEAYMLSGNFEKAKFYYKKALDLFLDENNSAKVVPLSQLGIIEAKMQNFEKAFEYFSQALDVDSKDAERLYSVWKAMANVYVEIGELDKAIDCFDKSIRRKDKSSILKLDNIDLTHQVLFSVEKMASLNRRKYTVENEIAYLTKAADLYSLSDSLLVSLRRMIPSQNDEVEFNIVFNDLYDGAVEANYQLYKETGNTLFLNRAFYYTEKSKSSVLLNSLMARETLPILNVPDSIFDTETALKSKISFYADKLHQKALLDSQKVVQYENALFQSKNDLESLILHLRKNYPDFYNLVYQDTYLSILDVQRRLNSNETVIEYHRLKNELIVFIVSKKEVNTVKVATPDDLDQLIFDYRNAMQSHGDYSQLMAYGERVSDYLLKSIVTYIHTDNLIILPDQALWFVNFEALPIEVEGRTTYLLYKYAVSYANSLNHLYLKQNQNRKNLIDGCLAFSYSEGSDLRGENIDFSRLRDSDENLPGTSREISEIAKLIPGMYYYGFEASERNFKKRSMDYSILHLALHAEIDDINSDNSYLKFHQNNKDTLEDNLLHVYELYNMKINADLAVLSACNTGSGVLKSGEGIMSLGRAFQYAGVDGLMISNWVLVDDVAPQIIKEFYSNLKDGHSKSESLRNAKIAYLNSVGGSLSHPYFWAGLTLIGNQKPIYKNNTDKYMTIAIGGAVVVLLIFFLRRRLAH